MARERGNRERYALRLLPRKFYKIARIAPKQAIVGAHN
jgi:hypothetical protein